MTVCGYAVDHPPSSPSSISSQNHSEMDSSSFPNNNDAGRAGDDDVFKTPPSLSQNAHKRKDNPVQEPEKDECSSKPVKQRVTRSYVWEHFTRLLDDNNKCRCNYCGRMMSCLSSSGTSNLQKHLLSYGQFKLWQDQKSHQFFSPDGRDGTVRLNRVSEDVFRQAANEMIVLGELPLAFADSLAWKHFCNRINLYKPQSRRTSTRNIVDMYVKRKTVLKKELSLHKQRVSLTTDIWTAPTTGASYMVITAHYIDRNWCLRKFIIGFKNVSDHRGATISAVLLECLSEWGIKKVFTITVDNATANTSAITQFKESFKRVGTDALVLGGEFMHMRCAAHIINLVVKDGMNEIDKSVSAVRNSVTYVRSSTARLKSFELRVDSGKMSRGSLSLDCKTRWNSTYLMLCRGLKFRLAFDKMEAEDKLYNEYFQEKEDGKKTHGPPSTDDWDQVERLVSFLNIFYNSTLVVSTSSVVSSHKCYNEIVTIERNLIKLSNDMDEEMRKKATVMRQKFDKYWDGLKEINSLLIIASVFDPRNKMKFAMLCFEKLYGKDSPDYKALVDKVKNVMRRLFEEYSIAFGVCSSEQHTQSQSVASSQTSHGIESIDRVDLEDDHVKGYERMDSVYKEMVDEIGIDDASTELDHYLNESVENLKTILRGTKYDILSWWKVNATIYPILSEIAKDVLAMPVSSVASESAFSTSGRILDPHRSCLTHFMIEVLMCTEQWMKSDINFNANEAPITNKQVLAEIEQLDILEKEVENETNSP